MTEALSGFDCVFHCAYDWRDEGWNYTALEALIAACRTNDCKLVYVSSFVVYDIPPSGEVTEATIPTTATAGYSFVKLRLEQRVLRAVEEEDLDATIVQPTIVYGPHGGAWTLGPTEMLLNGTVVLPDRGKGICNAVFVDDVAEGMILAALSKRSTGRRYLLSGPPTTWGEFYEAMAAAADAPPPRYVSSDIILRKTRSAAKLARLLTSPLMLARRLAWEKPVRRGLNKMVQVLPRQLSEMLSRQVLGPEGRCRGYVHWPDRGRLNFLSGRSAIHSDRARQELGYSPNFDFVRGMVCTRPFLQEARKGLLS